MTDDQREAERSGDVIDEVRRWSRPEKMRSFEVDGVRFARVRASAQTTGRAIAHPDDGAAQLVLYVQLTGRGWVIQDERSAELGPRDICLYDTSRPYSLVQSGDVTGLCVAMPADSVGVGARARQSLTAVRVDGTDPMAMLVRRTMAALEEGMPATPPPTRRRIAQSVVGLVETFCLHLAAQQPTDRPPARRDQIDQVLSFIDENLGDPDLTPPMIAAAHYMSVRALYNLAREFDLGIAGWIRRRRLQRCRADLADPALAAEPISLIAARWGLPRPAHFTRVFRAEYGIAPSTYRQARLHPSADC